MKNIIIVGASGHAKVIIDIIELQEEFNIVGLIDSFKPVGTEVCGYEIIGTENDLPRLIDTLNLTGGIIAIGDNYTRKQMADKIKISNPEFSFYSAIHPNATIGKGVSIGNGSVVVAGAIINADSTIGDFCIVNTNASVGHECIMKDYSSMAPGSTLGGNSNVGLCTSVCLGANIIHGIDIGSHCIIGAGSTVVKPVEDLVMVYGVPGRVIKNLEKGAQYLK
ncbi:sugar O-acyltransferase, sialic acid O-acetyltransferase NeuD family [Zhouia amylolytica]|uniref:Sugar O-acyltransferase, sialic acid O-acetyltransferase NeuD family n=1 Tax=Zhouia amylolytica TaxID=376730 RepID=A0A1I6VKG7_9FLAO|nr:acetyltransferase [Zhouia amylolytica]SFT14149.1 sugar O-acyltransferase, sialic acid O-acetyltransferase NeuD family [Zhouia amylolytica]